MIPSWLFSIALWSATAVVAVGAVFLLVTLFREWRRGSLW